MIRRIGLAVIAIMAVPFILTLVYTVIPPVSTLMVGRWLTFQPVSRDWVPLEEISPHLPRAVVTAEDGQFCFHGGVDWKAIQDVLDAAEDGVPSRGASTIAMQTAKNLFLWPGGAYIRKPFEIVLATWIDLVWTKRRTIEVYLNIAEWGPDGIFGAEAGAQHGFGKAAKNIGPREAALMAAALPNPIVRDTAKPTRGQRSWANTIAARARQSGEYVGCLDL
ncbi:monofunctional biosynthetic peptidoglycan transglycosylase [Agaricicola taiwanensis]|nr:monofunctional biosynthetic peptidoglycan transglycosylase [Agaricicola taiwanensis]